jgi:hypothetical protein
MKNLYDLNANIRFGKHGGSDFVRPETAALIESMSAQGYEIIVGNNPFLNRAKKYAGRECIRISQVNGRQQAICVRTIWAVK